MKDESSVDLLAEVERLVGKVCWYVSTGGAASTTFQLAIGSRIPREFWMPNTAHSDEFQKFRGEFDLFVWCAWRLDGADGPLTSWDDVDEIAAQTLELLVGQKIASVNVKPPSWDLTIAFDRGHKLKVFCDHVIGDPSFDGNWDLLMPEKEIYIGASSRCKIEYRN